MLRRIEGIISFHLKFHFLKSSVYVGRKQKKNRRHKRAFLCGSSENLRFSSGNKELGDNFSFETLFIEIVWEFAEIFDFEYFLGSRSIKNVHDKTKNIWQLTQTLYILFISASKPYMRAIYDPITLCFILILLILLLFISTF